MCFPNRNNFQDLKHEFLKVAVNSTEFAQFEALINLLNAYYSEELASCVDNLEVANCSSESGCPSMLISS